MLTRAFPAFEQVVLNVLRIGTALLFMQHGAQKLFGWIGGFGGEPGNTAQLLTQMGLAGVLEFWGGLLILVGLFTRPVAVVLAIEMLWAYFQAHLPRGGWPLANQGELALLYFLVYVYLVGRGPGSFSLDAVLFGRRERAEAAAVRAGA